MPKMRAMKLLYQTPRLYKSNTQLVCPKTQATFPTL
jgi:hypothetical protein